jgi:hypothetical protein
MSRFGRGISSANQLLEFEATGPGPGWNWTGAGGPLVHSLP